MGATNLLKTAQKVMKKTIKSSGAISQLQFVSIKEAAQISISVEPTSPIPIKNTKKIIQIPIILETGIAIIISVEGRIEVQIRKDTRTIGVINKVLILILVIT